jgi:putative redox protein
MMEESRAVWNGGMAFTVRQDGHGFILDGSGEFGGHDLGPRPKNLLLTALAGCTGMDVVSILGKMKITGFGLEVVVHGQLGEEHPVIFTSITIEYRFRGTDLPREKLERAVTLSQEKYCGVSAMLSRSSEISWAITMLGEDA